MRRRRKGRGYEDEVARHPDGVVDAHRPPVNEPVLALQQRAGNAAVTSLLRREAGNSTTLRRDVAGPTAARPPRPRSASAQRSILQRHEEDLAEPAGTGRSILAEVGGPIPATGPASTASTHVQRQAKAAAITYPAFGNVALNGTVRNANWKAWRETVQATTKTTRREQGHWVQWDTTTLNNANGTYRIAGASVGPAIAPTAGASMTPTAKPADKGNWHTVAYFHTHTPTRFRPVGRGVGPSTADENFHNGQNVTGVVRDYKGRGGNIPKGHPLWAPTRYYHTGPKRRI